MQEIRVHLSPAGIVPKDLAGCNVAMIDLFRASTTICHALASGATTVLPFAEVDEVRRAAEQAISRGEQAVLGGERGGKRIDDFDLGNSPREYTADAVGGRRVLFTTTNGTRALHLAAQAERVVVAALVNLSAVVEVLKDCPSVDILCAGSSGRLTLEDVVAAGAYVHRLCPPGREQQFAISDDALVARATWIAAEEGTDRVDGSLLSTITSGRHGKTLKKLHYAEDLAVCLDIDKLNCVPMFDPSTGAIQLTTSSQ